MRRKPKVERIIREASAPYAIAEIESYGIPAAVLMALDEAGYDVRPKREWERDRERAFAAEGEAAYLRDEAKSIEEWGRKGYEEARHLRDRCSFLYRVAQRKGATRVELDEDATAHAARGSEP